MITPIDVTIINDHTELLRSKLIKTTIILDSGKRERITSTIMDAGNGVNRRVLSATITDIRSEFAMQRFYNKFKGEK